MTVSRAEGYFSCRPSVRFEPMNPAPPVIRRFLGESIPSRIIKRLKRPCRIEGVLSCAVPAAAEERRAYGATGASCFLDDPLSFVRFLCALPASPRNDMTAVGCVLFSVIPSRGKASDPLDGVTILFPLMM